MPTQKDPATGDAAARAQPDTVDGAGDYEVARTEDDAVREFVEAGEVQKSPHDAAPQERDDSTRPDGAADDARQQDVARPPQGN